MPSYREGWERKLKWYEEKMGIPVIGLGAMEVKLEPGQFPIVITSRDSDDAMTLNVYSHTIPGMQKEAAQKMDEITAIIDVKELFEKVEGQNGLQ